MALRVTEILEFLSTTSIVLAVLCNLSAVVVTTPDIAEDTLVYASHKLTDHSGREVSTCMKTAPHCATSNKEDVTHLKESIITKATTLNDRYLVVG